MSVSPSLNPHVSVDCVIFGFSKETLRLLLIKRTVPNSLTELDDSYYALQGDLVRDNENLDEAAARGESGPPSSHSPSLEPLCVSPPAASAASTRASAEVSTELRSLPPEPGDRPSCPLSRERSCPLSRERS